MVVFVVPCNNSSLPWKRKHVAVILTYLAYYGIIEHTM